MFPILFFTAVAFFLYGRPLFEYRYDTWYAFLTMIAVSVMGMRIVSGSLLILPTLLVFSAIFYFISGIKDYLFVKRARLYFISILILFYSIFIIFFLADKSEFFFLKYVALVFASFLLLREWLAIIPSFHFPKRELISAAAASFIITQLVWVVALLPIGFINASNFMLLLVFILSDLLFKHFMGSLSKEVLIQHLTFFLVLSAIIFWTSQWSLII